LSGSTPGTTPGTTSGTTPGGPRRPGPAGATGSTVPGPAGAPRPGSGTHGRAADGPPAERVWSADEHLADILDRLHPLDPIELQLLDAQDCVLVEDVTVPVALPPFDNSSMDGYAVRAADTARAAGERPAILAVVGDVAAGAGRLPEVGPRQAARIMTGAPLPPGTDAVVPVEWTDGGEGRGPATAMRPATAHPGGGRGEVRVHRPVDTGQFVRARGDDVQPGEIALTAGTVLGPPQIALLAAIGRATVRVRPRPRVVVISTGSELVPPGEPLGPGRIHDSNSFMLTAAARDAGAIAYRVGGVTDDPRTLRATLEDQLIRADLVVTSGGVSVGAYDVVKEALSGLTPEDEGEDWAADAGNGGADAGTPGAEAAARAPGTGPSGAASDGTRPAPDRAVNGAEDDPSTRSSESGAHASRGGVEFRTLAMQPGKPQGFGFVGGGLTSARVPLLALPGNPVSAYVSFELFVRPAIRTLMGVRPVHRPRVRAELREGVASSPAGRRQFLRGVHDPERGTVTPVGGAGSHLVKALAGANCLIVVDEAATSVPAGAEVDVVLLG
jgi:molybdopterin molybdotransferase